MGAGRLPRRASDEPGDDWAKGKRRSLDVELDELDLEMHSTVDGDDMVCEGDDGSDVELDLERLDDED